MCLKRWSALGVGGEIGFYPGKWVCKTGFLISCKILCLVSRPVPFLPCDPSFPLLKVNENRPAIMNYIAGIEQFIIAI